jgi:hypothetical protein
MECGDPATGGRGTAFLNFVKAADLAAKKRSLPAIPRGQTSSS